MANVNATVIELAPLAGATNAGLKVGLLVSTVKAAQNDTVTITNAKAVTQAFLQIVATGVAEANTLSTNVITATSATTGSVFGLVIYR